MTKLVYDKRSTRYLVFMASCTRTMFTETVYEQSESVWSWRRPRWRRSSQHPCILTRSCSLQRLLFIENDVYGHWNQIIERARTPRDAGSCVCASDVACTAARRAASRPHLLPYADTERFSKWSRIHCVVTDLGRSRGRPSARSQTRDDRVPIARLTPKSTV